MADTIIYRVSIRGVDARGPYTLQTDLTAGSPYGALTRALNLWNIEPEMLTRIHVQIASEPDR